MYAVLAGVCGQRLQAPDAVEREGAVAVRGAGGSAGAFLVSRRGRRVRSTGQALPRAADAGSGDPIVRSGPGTVDRVVDMGIGMVMVGGSGSESVPVVRLRLGTRGDFDGHVRSREGGHVDGTGEMSGDEQDEPQKQPDTARPGRGTRRCFHSRHTLTVRE